MRALDKGEEVGAGEVGRNGRWGMRDAGCAMRVRSFTRWKEFLPKLQAILEGHKLNYNIHGHAGNGNFHIIPLIEKDARLAEKMILDVSNEVYSLVLSLGGSITAEHNDGIIRTPFLLDQYGAEIIALFAEVKKIFDPQTIFNPGKKVGLMKSDIGKYLIRG